MTFHATEFFPAVLTFFFVFAVVFGAFSYTRIFERRINAVLAAVFALFSAAFPPLVTGLQAFLPIGAVIIVILFFFLFLRRMFEARQGQHVDAFPIALSLGIALVLLGVLWNRLNVSLPFIDSSNMLWLIGIVLVVLIFYVAYRAQ